MNLAFILHLYQPPTQTDSALKSVLHECYSPLIKLLKTKTAAKFTLNVPLSLLEQLDKTGQTELITHIKDLVDTDRVELVGSAAYHPLLSKLPAELMSKQIVLNEYGLGYYFGQRQGFEGEIAMLVRDIKGFFPPELAVNSDVIKTLAELSYEWVVVDPAAFSDPKLDQVQNGQKEPDGSFAYSQHESTVVYKLADFDIKIVTRDANLSNILSFKRDDTVDDLIDYLAASKEKGIANILVALDGETFGHHNKYGIDMLENLIEALMSIGINIVSASELISQSDVVPTDVILESTWSTLIRDGKREIYPLWEGGSNIIQSKLWDIQKLFIKGFDLKKYSPHADESLGNLPVWKNEDLDKLGDSSLRDYLKAELLFYKSLHSDQYWWASNMTLKDKVLFSPLMIKNALGIYDKLIELMPGKINVDKFRGLSKEIIAQLPQ